MGTELRRLDPPPRRLGLAHASNKYSSSEAPAAMHLDFARLHLATMIAHRRLHLNGHSSRYSDWRGANPAQACPPVAGHPGHWAGRKSLNFLLVLGVQGVQGEKRERGSSQPLAPAPARYLLAGKTLLQSRGDTLDSLEPPVFVRRISPERQSLSRAEDWTGLLCLARVRCHAVLPRDLERSRVDESRSCSRKVAK